MARLVCILALLAVTSCSPVSFTEQHGVATPRRDAGVEMSNALLIPRDGEKTNFDIDLKVRDAEADAYPRDVRTNWDFKLVEKDAEPEPLMDLK